MFDKESNRSNDWHACEGCNVRGPHEGVALHTSDQVRLEFHETIDETSTRRSTRQVADSHEWFDARSHASFADLFRHHFAANRAHHRSFGRHRIRTGPAVRTRSLPPGSGRAQRRETEPARQRTANPTWNSGYGRPNRPRGARRAQVSF